jgi:hypothetical protein
LADIFISILLAFLASSLRSFGGSIDRSVQCCPLFCNTMKVSVREKLMSRGLVRLLLE